MVKTQIKNDPGMESHENPLGKSNDNPPKWVRARLGHRGALGHRSDTFTEWLRSTYFPKEQAYVRKRKEQTESDDWTCTTMETATPKPSFFLQPKGFVF
jgi:hypothetical protein